MPIPALHTARAIQFTKITSHTPATARAHQVRIVQTQQLRNQRTIVLQTRLVQTAAAITAAQTIHISNVLEIICTGMIPAERNRTANIARTDVKIIHAKSKTIPAKIILARPTAI